MQSDFISMLDDVEKLIKDENLDMGVSIIFSNLINRSRILLSSRSKSEISAIADDIERILTEFMPLAEDAACEIWDRYDDIAPTRFSAPQMLRFCVGNISLHERDVVSNPEWSEYFAVLALDHFTSFVNYAKGHASIFKDENKVIFSCNLPGIMRVGDAHEAITMAESLDEKARLSSEIGQLLKEKIFKKTSKQNKNAAQQKHKKTKTLLRRLEEFYKTGDFKSMKAAVQAFLDTTPESEYNHLAPTNRERTLCNGLSDVLKGKRKLD
ncbi:MAG: hypothetical protein KZQ94_07340 [Candidatus Thiodiazotropha sp. (ex Troendleina suluensis)]|nr:hypothetical protein [Candidatus Thiodiazotropha sp. (ex Troendleina suluensis)]